MNNLLINKSKEIEKLFRLYADDVFRFAYSKVLDREIALEVVSDTFLTLSEVFEKFDKDSNIKSFIFGIAFNKVRQSWKKKSAISFDEEIHTIDNPKPSKQRHKLFNKLVEIINSLPKNYKDVINLRFMEHKSIKEVSQLLSVSQSNVTTIQNRAIKKILKIFNETK